MFKSYKVGELVYINGTNKVGLVIKDTRLAKKPNMAITWVHILDENYESPFMNNALASVDT